MAEGKKQSKKRSAKIDRQTALAESGVDAKVAEQASKGKPTVLTGSVRTFDGASYSNDDDLEELASKLTADEAEYLTGKGVIANITGTRKPPKS